jgi:Domain of unknown function (DUF4382)
MNSKKTLFMIALLAVLMSSCSGLKGTCTTNCGSGDALLSVTMTDTPPTNTSVVSFTLPVVGISLVPSSGSQVQVFTSGNFELTRLQSDTSLVTTNVKIAAGTYTAVNVTVSPLSGVLINPTTNNFGTTCLAGDVCAITGAAATVTYTFPTALTLTANSNQWLNLDFNFNNAIVTNNNNVVGIDVTQTGVMTASTTVPVGVTAGNFANVDDFTGQITALSSSSLTVASKLRGSITATINSTTTLWFDPQNQCPGGASISCVGVGSVVSLQGLLSNTGVVTATSLDIIDKATSPADEVEGIIYPSSCAGGYAIILSDRVINTSGSPLASAPLGTGVCLTINQAALFAIDTGILTGQAGVPISNAAGFRGTSDILEGQMVRAQITGATTGANNLINANATVMLLRFSRLTGTVSQTAGNVFTISGLPAYLGTTFNVPPQVITYVNATILEGETNVGSLNGTVSMTALYLNANDGAQYWFQAAKVRQQ